MAEEQILFKYCKENNIPIKYAINYKETLSFAVYLLRFRIIDFFNSLFKKYK